MSFQGAYTNTQSSDVISTAMFRIGDFSRLAQVSVRTLRHYDELELLNPAHVDDLTDYRYYSIEQLPQLHRIVALKDMGFSLKEIAELAQHDVELADLKDMLAQKQAEVSQKIAAEQARLKRLAASLEQLEHADTTPSYNVTLKKVSPCKVFSKRYTVPHLMQMHAYCSQFYQELYEVIHAQNLNVIAPEFTLFHTDGYLLEDIDIEVCAVLDSESFDVLELPSDPSFSVHQVDGAKTVASIVFQGHYHDIPQVGDVLILWAGNSGYHSVGAAREIHLSGPIIETGKADPVVIELQAPVATNPF
jgi:DNA-binding transcriptional MerR regulator